MKYQQVSVIYRPLFIIGNTSCTNQFTCKESGLCVSSDAVWDGHKNCPHGEDEYFHQPFCPDSCNCFDQVLNCTKRYQTGFPTPTTNNTVAVDLSFNWHLPASKLEKWLSSSPYLVHLNLAGNDFSGLSSSVFQSFQKSKNLRWLDMSGTSLDKLRNAPFEYLERLRILKLRNNNLKRIQPRHLSPVKRIRFLDLGNTSLNNLKDELFEKSCSLEELRLDGNKISKLGEATFKKLTSLKVLDLRGNCIKEAARNSLSSLVNLKTLLMPTSDLCCLTDIQEARNICQVK